MYCQTVTTDDPNWYSHAARDYKLVQHRHISIPGICRCTSIGEIVFGGRVSIDSNMHLLQGGVWPFHRSSFIIEEYSLNWMRYLILCSHSITKDNLTHILYNVMKIILIQMSCLGCFFLSKCHISKACLSLKIFVIARFEPTQIQNVIFLHIAT